MNYTELADSDDEKNYKNSNIGELIREIKSKFEFGNVCNDESVMVDTESVFYKEFTTLKEEYQLVMINLLETYDTIEKNKSQIKTLQDLIIKSLSLDLVEYEETFRTIVNDFIDKCKIDELKEKLHTNSHRLQELKKLLQLTSQCDPENSYTCYICLDRGINTILSPCGHTLCDECNRKNLYRETKVCPFCREIVDYSKRFYL